MDELATAAATMAMSVDVDFEADEEPDSTTGIVAAAEVLQTIDGNTGEPKAPDCPSNFPPAVRGARSLHDLLTRFTLFWLGRDLRW